MSGAEPTKAQQRWNDFVVDMKQLQMLAISRAAEAHAKAMAASEREIQRMLQEWAESEASR
jgi:hypothetical protein